MSRLPGVAEQFTFKAPNFNLVKMFALPQALDRVFRKACKKKLLKMPYPAEI